NRLTVAEPGHGLVVVAGELTHPLTQARIEDQRLHYLRPASNSRIMSSLFCTGVVVGRPKSGREPCATSTTSAIRGVSARRLIAAAKSSALRTVSTESKPEPVKMAAMSMSKPTVGCPPTDSCAPLLIIR